MAPPKKLSDESKLAVTVYLEEYKAMRAEILEHLKFQAIALTFGTSVLGAATAALATIYGRSTHTTQDQVLTCFLLAALPVFAFLFGMWMVHKESMVAEIALYIHTTIRSKLEDLLPGQEFLQWDVFRSTRTYDHLQDKPPRVLSVFGHAFFGLFMAGSAWFAFDQMPSNSDPNVETALRVVVAIDLVLLLVFILSASRVARMHLAFHKPSKTALLDQDLRHLSNHRDLPQVETLPAAPSDPQDGSKAQQDPRKEVPVEPRL